MHLKFIEYVLYRMSQRQGTVSKGLTQRELFARSDRRIIQEIVSEQERVIDTAILTAHKAGFNQIEHELPQNFNINNLDKADAQTLIYSEILMMYKKPEGQGGKEVESVTIDVGIKPMLHIKWLNGMDDDERHVRKEYIKQCIRTPRSLKR